jgi:hypothetical protein
MHTDPSKPAHNPDVQYEKSDATVRPLYQFLFWISVITILTAIFAFVVLRALESWRDQASARSSMAQPQGEQVPPAPRLQIREPLDLAKFRAEEAAILNSYGVVDADKGIYRIPIAEAMRLTLERGLPAPSGPATAPAASASPAPSTAARP